MSILFFICFDRKKRILKRIRANLIDILILGIAYFLCILGMLLTEEAYIANGFKKVETQASLLLFPIIFSCLTFSRDDLFKLIRWLYLILLLAFFLSTAYSFSTNGFHLNELMKWFAEHAHRTYVSLYIVFLSTTLFLFFSTKKTANKKHKTLGVLVLAVGILISQILESRMALVCIIIIMGMLVLIMPDTRMKWIGLICILGFMVFSLFILMPNSSRGKTFIEKYKKVFVRDEHYRPYHFEIRFGVWESSLIVIKENLMFGVGTGDVDHELKSASAKNLLPKHLHYTNVHNQYLDMILRYGLFGFVIWIITIIYFFRIAMLRKDYSYIIFLVTVHVFFLTENIIGRQMGVMFYSIFNSMFYFVNKKDKTIAI
ncbi:MAG: O-antigen ligase family protein [Croceivirga sp.]